MRIDCTRTRDLKQSVAIKEVQYAPRGSARTASGQTGRGRGPRARGPAQAVKQNVHINKHKHALGSLLSHTHSLTHVYVRCKACSTALQHNRSHSSYAAR